MGKVGAVNTVLNSVLSVLIVRSASDCSVVRSEVPYYPCACRCTKPSYACFLTSVLFSSVYAARGVPKVLDVFLYYF